MTNLFGHRIRSELLYLFAAEGFAGFAAVCLLLTLSEQAAGRVTGDLNSAPYALAAVLALGSIVVSGAGGLYRLEAWSRAGRLLLGGAVAGLLLLPLAVAALLAFGPTHPGLPLWRETAYLILATLAAGWLIRLAFVGAWHGGVFNRRLVVVRLPSGRGSAGQAWGTDAVSDHGYGYEVAFSVQPGEDLAAALRPERLRAARIWGVVCEGGVLPSDTQRTCQAAGTRVFDKLGFAEASLGRVNTGALHEGWLAAARGAREGGVEACLRRAFDIAVSGALLLFFLPVVALAAVAIKLDSTGPVFYTQERVGRGGRVFTLFKFRSMVADAEKGGAAQWAVKRDSRVTRVGRFMRLTRIDEIPQVFNVLRGDMGIVGPRPERPAFVETLGKAIPHYHDRACVKPGITGWAQVNFPYGASVEDARMKLAYDLYYVKRRSLFLDLLVLVATVRVVLFQEGSR